MMNDNKEKRVALYIRVANADQLTVDNQEAELRQYAAQQGYTEPLVYRDNGYNGLNFHRPAFMKMEQAIQDGIIGRVITKDLSRIGRNTVEVINWLDNLKKKDVAFDSKKQLCPAELETMSAVYNKSQTRATALMKKGKHRQRER